MPRSPIGPNGDLIRCNCGKLSLRLPGSTAIHGCACHQGGWLLGAVPEGTIPVIDEKTELESGDTSTLDGREGTETKLISA